MSQENVEVVRTMVAIFNRTGFLPEALFDPEIELFNIRESPLPGPYRGYGGLLQWRKGVFEVIDEGRFEIDDVLDVDASDLVIYKNRLLGRARHTGIEIDISWTNVQWFREGGSISPSPSRAMRKPFKLRACRSRRCRRKTWTFFSEP